MSVLPILPFRLDASRRKMALLFVTALAFAVGGFALAQQRPLVGYPGMAFFGLGAIVGVVGLLPGSTYLELTRSGFTYCSLFRRRFVPWERVREFLPIRIHNNEMVGWNFAAGGAPEGVVKRIAATIAGADDALPDTYGMKSVELAELLNAVLRRERARL